MRTAVLLRDYRTKYRDPLRFARGATVQVGRRDEEWPEFLWATDAGGRSGWVHQRWLDGERGPATALRDYSARELDAAAGEPVRLLEEAGGWWWCENLQGAQGWLPARDLRMDDRSPS